MTYYNFPKITPWIPSVQLLDQNETSNLTEAISTKTGTQFEMMQRGGSCHWGRLVSPVGNKVASCSLPRSYLYFVQLSGPPLEELSASLNESMTLRVGEKGWDGSHRLGLDLTSSNWNTLKTLRNVSATSTIQAASPRPCPADSAQNDYWYLHSQVKDWGE